MWNDILYPKGVIPMLFLFDFFVFYFFNTKTNKTFDKHNFSNIKLCPFEPPQTSPILRNRRSDSFLFSLVPQSPGSLTPLPQVKRIMKLPNSNCIPVYRPGDNECQPVSRHRELICHLRSAFHIISPSSFAVLGVIRAGGN